jgi:hypothetical protein
MAMQFGTTLRTNQVGQIQSTVGGSGTLTVTPIHRPDATEVSTLIAAAALSRQAKRPKRWSQPEGRLQEPRYPYRKPRKTLVQAAQTLSAGGSVGIPALTGTLNVAQAPQQVSALIPLSMPDARRFDIAGDMRKAIVASVTMAATVAAEQRSKAVPGRSLAANVSKDQRSAHVS